jgi:uncharacterized protein
LGGYLVFSLGQALGILDYALIAGVTLFASIIGGVAGYGTGLLLPPVLVPLIGAEAVVPVIALSALFTNASRIMAFRLDFNTRLFWRITVIALPTTILGAYGYSLLSGPAVSVLIGFVLIVLVPLRRILKRQKVLLSGRRLDAASLGYGVVVGGTAGSGVMLISLLVGAGLNGMAVIATDAGISLVLGLVKTMTFASVGALSWRMVILAVLIGLCAMPGAFVAKRLALKLSGDAHILILDAVVIIGGILLIWRGASG